MDDFAAVIFFLFQIFEVSYMFEYFLSCFLRFLIRESSCYCDLLLFITSDFYSFGIVVYNSSGYMYFSRFFSSFKIHRFLTIIFN